MAGGLGQGQGQGEEMAEGGGQPVVRKEVVPPTEDEYLWMWKVRLPPTLCAGARLADSIVRLPQPELETTRRTFFL